MLWYDVDDPMRHVAVLLAFLLLLAGCGETSSSTSDTSASSAAPTATSADDEPDDGGAGATVVEVVDGDTVDVELDGEPETVRLIGINTPERGECLAEEASQRLQELVARAEVELVADESDRDQYGRLLRYVEVDGLDVGAELVRSGLALARRYPPDTARADEYDDLQQDAADAGAGMWAADACGDGATGAQVVINEIRFDADGDDGQNLNDEWVRIANVGDASVDLTGWVLKDTSASHRYSFPSGFVLGAGADVTVRSGCGTDTATDLHWCSDGSAVWNNSGDIAFLLDPAGNIVHSVEG